VLTVRPAATAIIVTLLAGKNSRGFSLLELVLVLMVLGLSGLIVLPNVEKGLRDRDLRSQALQKGVPQRLVLNVSESSYRIARNEVHFPSNVKIASVVGGEVLDNGNRQFLFFPNGSTFGGRIDLSSGADSASYSIRLHPLTGTINVMRGDNS
jgi:prepilin-type N-terminal cleavage/methylation domain-containing protein